MAKIYIIGGKFKGRKIEVLDYENLRPTPNRIRETLFNWLNNYLAGARVLDAFAGSGALGLEALSRGAEKAVFYETNSKAAEKIKENLKFWGANGEVIKADALKSSAPLKAYDLIFLDPPFASNFFNSALEKFSSPEFLKNTGLIYLEAPNFVELPNNLEIIKQKKAGAVVYSLLKSKEI